MDIHSYNVTIFGVLLALNVVLFLFSGKPFSVYFFRPSQVAINYVLFSFLFGAILFSHGNVYYKNYINESALWSWQTILYSSIFMFSLIIHSYIYSYKIPTLFFKKNDCYALPKTYGVLGLILIYIYTKTEFYPLYMLGLPLATVPFFNEKFSFLTKFTFVIFFLVVLAPVAIFSKRLLIFPILSIIILLTYGKKISLLKVALVPVMLMVMILSFSVLRGYGGVQVDSFYSLLNAVYLYVNSDIFYSALGNNTEVTYFYFHSLNAIHIFNDDIGELLFGKTLLKGVLLGWNSTGLSLPIISSIDAYTKLYDPSFRNIGGSFPVNYLSELFMNFHILGVFFALLITDIFERFWFYCIKAKTSIGSKVSMALFLFIFILYYRGSSFDILVYNLILAVIFVCIIESLQAMLKKNDQ
ncbi:O-antigen polymerase [Alteromonas sp. S167]|uniref:O-antigen polymerase n=1 Tax=Alteromonas sp. S167 TaxID=3117402 RepID=UPI002FDF43FD